MCFANIDILTCIHTVWIYIYIHMCAFTLKYFQHTRLPTSMMFCDGCGFLILEETSRHSGHMVSSDDIQPDTEREDRRTGTLVIPCFESNKNTQEQSMNWCFGLRKAVVATLSMINKLEEVVKQAGVNVQMAGQSCQGNKQKWCGRKMRRQ